MTTYYVRPERPDHMTGGDFRALINDNPYWGFMAKQFERAATLYWSEGRIAHIVATFKGMPVEGWGEIDGKVLLPFPVAGDPVEMVDLVTQDLDFAAHMFAQLYEFIPARFATGPLLSDLYPENTTKQ